MSLNGRHKNFSICQGFFGYLNINGDQFTVIMHLTAIKRQVKRTRKFTRKYASLNKLPIKEANHATVFRCAKLLGGKKS